MKLNKTHKAILRFLKQNKHFYPMTKIAEAVGMTKEEVKPHVKKLVNAGLAAMSYSYTYANGTSDTISTKELDLSPTYETMVAKKPVQSRKPLRESVYRGGKGPRYRKA